LVRTLLCGVLNLYLLALFIRIILSWFPISPGSAMAQIFSVLYTITEPVLGPVRRAIPPIGMGIDISPLILIIGIQIVGSIVLGCRIGL
jgi:YggT family protein